MKIQDFKKFVVECVREVIQECKIEEGNIHREKKYNTAESNVFDRIFSVIAKPENLSTKHSKYTAYFFKNAYAIDGDISLSIASPKVIVRKMKQDGEFVFKKGNISDLSDLLKSLVSVDEINGTPEYPHENYGMLESDTSGESSGEFKYTVSYKLYNDKNQLIRNRDGVEIYGPDFGDHKEEERKFLEDRCFTMETEMRRKANERNTEISPISGKVFKYEGDVKIVGLIVKKKTEKDPYKKTREMPAFDADTVKHLSRPLPPGSSVD